MKIHAENLRENFTYELKKANDINLDKKEEKNQFINFARMNGKNNPKMGNHVDLIPFEYSVTERITQQRDE